MIPFWSRRRGRATATVRFLASCLLALSLLLALHFGLGAGPALAQDGDAPGAGVAPAAQLLRRVHRDDLPQGFCVRPASGARACGKPLCPLRDWCDVVSAGRPRLPSPATGETTR